MTADDSGARAQVWEAVRRLSDAQLARLQQQLLAPLGTRVVLGDNQAEEASGASDWRPSDVVHALLGHLHHVVHLQQADVPPSSSPPAVAAAAKSDPIQRTPRSVGVTTPTATAATTTFALAKDDFPSLQPAASANGSGSAKTAKRRITTTLVSDQSAITRPVRTTTVAFPTDAANPWAKRELLERRMMVALEPGSGSSNSSKTLEFPALSPPLAKTRVPLSNLMEARTLETPPRKLFDDSPPGGPKRVQPFPVHATNQQQVEPQSPAATTPLKNSGQHQSAQPPALLCVKPKRPRRQSLLSSTPSDSSSQLALTPPAENASASVQQLKSADDVSTNLQAAKLYAFLINNRLAGSTCAELQLLVSLLFRTTCVGASSVDAGTAPNSDLATRCATPSEFCWRSHCLQFAAAVFTGIESLLSNLETELLRLLMSSLADADICSDMLARLQGVVQQREELRVAESARIGCKLPVETKASAVRDFALPFCEEIDSRLHYRSPTESVMYANREKVRDGFLDLLRQFQKQQHSLVGIESAQVAASAVESANKLLAEVAPENRWWFAKFFVLELIQVGSNPFGESDKDLVLKIMEDKLVVKNPDRLRKLHRRFSSQKQSTKGPAAPANHTQQQQSASSHPSAGSNKANNNRNHTASSGGKSSGVTASNKVENSTKTPSSSSAGSGAQISASFEASREFFAENQQFFFHFLHSCDSYEFSQLVKYQLESQFQAIWKETAAAADPRKSFTDVVLRLKVVAKFLGYLRFAPHWHNSSSLVQLSKQNPAFQAAKKEAVWTLENVESVGLDVKLLLEQSVTDAKISKCVPWLCDYLTMLSLDKLSLVTTYFKQLLVLLARIYRSPRLSALGETGLYVGMQIERVFHVLDFDVASYLDDAQLQLAHLQPSENLLNVLQEVPSPTQSEDHLPFLYSHVFVQSCVSELEDLRGFIQTRAKPSHRVAKRSAGGVNGPGSSRSSSSINNSAIPLRKLRPLQVVTEDDHHSDELARTDTASEAAAAAGLSDDDKLSEAIFKIHPNLRKVVEFVVEVVATNMCEHVLQQIVTPSADEFVQSCATESGLNLHDRAAANSSELESATILFLQLIENRTARSIHDSAGKSLAAAMQLCEEKVRASVPHLLPPACHPTLAQSVTLVALARTRGVVRNLIPKSSRSEFLKRLALRKKAVLKETASASAKSAAAGSNSENSVVRTLSTMFDEHAGVGDDTSHAELVAELKQTSAQIFKLSSAGRASATLDEWAKLHASLSRYVRSFKNSLGELLESEDGEELERPEQEENRPEKTVSHLLHELPVWDTMWRVLSSCLGVSAELAQRVAEWESRVSEDGSHRIAEGTARVLAKTVNGLADHLISLLAMVARNHGDDIERRRRTSRLLRVVTTAMQTLPQALMVPEGGVRDNQDESSELADRLVLSPRARVLAAIAQFASEADQQPPRSVRRQPVPAGDTKTTEKMSASGEERTQRRLFL